MKITGVNHPHLDPTARAKPTPAAGRAGQADVVAVSRRAKALAEARSPAVADAERIARLTKAIAKGDFMVDAEAIATRMIEEER